MAPFAVVLMAAGGALFWSLAFWLARRLSAGIWALIPCWAAIELLRAYIFTGFPWAAPSQAMVGSLLGQTLAWIGPHGLNFVVIGAAGSCYPSAAAVAACIAVGSDAEAGSAKRTTTPKVGS